MGGWSLLCTMPCTTVVATWYCSGFGTKICPQQDWQLRQTWKQDIAAATRPCSGTTLVNNSLYIVYDKQKKTRSILVTNINAMYSTVQSSSGVNPGTESCKTRLMILAEWKHFWSTILFTVGIATSFKRLWETQPNAPIITGITLVLISIIFPFNSYALIRTCLFFQLLYQQN